MCALVCMGLCVGLCLSVSVSDECVRACVRVCMLVYVLLCVGERIIHSPDGTKLNMSKLHQVQKPRGATEHIKSRGLSRDHTTTRVVLCTICQLLAYQT